MRRRAALLSVGCVATILAATAWAATAWKTVVAFSAIEFTGTLEQPAEADVRVGTGYGENGTEFTGTLAPGGGAGTVYLRRGR